MRIAVTYDQGQIFQRFGHTPQFKFYDVDEGKIIREQIVHTPAKKGHIAFVDFLKRMSVDIVICDRIGDEGQKSLKVAGIELYAGVKGNTDEVVKSLIAGTLSKNENSKANQRKGNYRIGTPISFY